jgi:hypothetical protein
MLYKDDNIIVCHSKKKKKNRVEEGLGELKLLLRIPSWCHLSSTYDNIQLKMTIFVILHCEVQQERFLWTVPEISPHRENTCYLYNLLSTYKLYFISITFIECLLCVRCVMEANITKVS